MDPCVDLAQAEARVVWGEDPIFPHPIGYDKMASGIKVMEARIGNRAQAASQKRPRLDSSAVEPGSRATTRGFGQPAADVRYLESRRGGQPEADVRYLESRRGGQPRGSGHYSGRGGSHSHSRRRGGRF
jgi:hypothetical protein